MDAPRVVDHDQARRAHGYHPLRVKTIVQETPDTRSYVLEVPVDLAKTFRYAAGQFCTFRVHLDGEEHLRCYSMSSAPETDADLTVTVKRVPGGLISNWFHDHVAEGDTLEVTKPAGVFCMRDGDRPLVAFCGGSGVTPVISVAKSALASTDRPVRMLYANRDRPSVIFDDGLRELASAHPDRLEVQLHLDDASGFLDRDAVATFAADHLEADFYICGPAPFMDLVEDTLLELGVEPGQILIERFATPDLPATVATLAAVDQPAWPATVHVTLKGATTDIAYQPGDTVLDTARRGGLAPPFSCEAGNCATCMALLHEGHVTMRANHALTAEEVDEGWILTCQSVPDGPDDVRVEYESF
ncbi:MAG TPA: ferredoxin--NADP reductase [Acidimicrobiales bacterium]|nr:ferredoxin--NADP reductase [Acidimicrobiales bacterium]